MPTLEQIKDKMKKLQEQAEKLIAKRAQSVLTDIRKLMEEHGLTTADIAAHSTGKNTSVCAPVCTSVNWAMVRRRMMGSMF